MNEPTCHEYGTTCALCGGNGVTTQVQANAMPNCPLAPSFTFPLGREGLRMVSARESVLNKQRAAQIKSLRISRRLSQVELARLTGIHRSLIAMMETGRAGCPEVTLEIIKAKGHRQ